MGKLITPENVSLIALAVSIASAIIAYRAKEQTRRHTEILQRAYLSVESGGIGDYDRDNGTFHGYVRCHNRGHLPARRLSWHIRIGTVQQGAEEFPIGEMRKPRSVVIPGTEMIVSAGTFFINNLRNELFVWGKVTYDDGFGNRRYTKFCHRYDMKRFLLGGEATYELPPEAGQIDERGTDAD
jgi:hypothetical protein